MDRVLRKIASQLDSYDEASYSALWEKYAAIVRDFEPSRRWREAVIILSIIQGIRFTNRLHNYNVAQTSRPGASPLKRPTLPLMDAQEVFEALKDVTNDKPKKGKILTFKRRDED